VTQKTHCPLIIIGAGPAGLMAGYGFGKGALILEGMHQAGIKLLMSGSGQCNLSSAQSAGEFLSQCGKAANFLKPALYSFDFHALRQLFEEYNCPLVQRADKKVFPSSLKAKDVLVALQKMASDSGAEISYRCKVLSIRYTDGAYQLCTTMGEYYSPKIVIACGGRSYPQSGSDGALMPILKKLGIAMIEQKPALTSIATKEDFSVCAGISFTPHRLYIAQKAKQKLRPLDILFTHRGLSGPGILDNSYLFDIGEQLVIDFIGISEEEFDRLVCENPNKGILNILKALGLAERLGEKILDFAMIEPTLKCNNMRREQRKSLYNMLCAFPFTIKEIDGWDKAMASAGGIDIKAVNAQSMESRSHSGIFFAGEVLGYNLPSGGYNIHAAMATGLLAGRQAHKTLGENQ